MKLYDAAARICAINTRIKPGTHMENKGDRLVMTIKLGADGVYCGTAFDPRRDITYKLTLRMNGDRMTAKGCTAANLFCEGSDWTRIN